MLAYFGALERRPLVPIAMQWEDQMFTIMDAVSIAADLAAPTDPTAADIAAILTDGIAEGMLPDEPRYHSLARIAARLPERTVTRLCRALIWSD